MANRQVCAWCAKEGVLTVIQEGDEPTSHGICAYHSQQVEAEYVAQLESR